MTKQLTATQVFLRALKETGEYDHVNYSQTKDLWVSWAESLTGFISPQA